MNYHELSWIVWTSGRQWQRISKALWSFLVVKRPCQLTWRQHLEQTTTRCCNFRLHQLQLRDVNPDSPAYDASHLKSWNLWVRVGGWCWGPQHCVCRLCRSTQQLRCVGRIARCGAAAHHPHSAAGFPRPGNQMPHSHCQAKARTSNSPNESKNSWWITISYERFRHPYRAWPQSDLDRLACVWTGMSPAHHPISTHSRCMMSSIDIGIFVVPLSWEEIKQVYLDFLVFLMISTVQSIPYSILLASFPAGWCWFRAPQTALCFGSWHGFEDTSVWTTMNDDDECCDEELEPGPVYNSYWRHVDGIWRREHASWRRSNWRWPSLNPAGKVERNLHTFQQASPVYIF